MKKLTVAWLALLVLTLPQIASAFPTLVLKNQYGEESINYVLAGTCAVPASSANTILSNLTGSTAAPIANTYAAVSVKLLPTQLLTGFTSGAGTIAGTDTVLQAIEKLSGDVQNKALKTFTSAAGAGGAATEALVVTGLLATDTILAVSQSVKGANSLPLLGFNTPAANALTGVWSANPGAGSVIVVTVLR
jgi:hypothetical protein